MSGFVSEEMAEKALHYLLDTSPEFAQANAESKYYYQQRGHRWLTHRKI